LLDLFFNHFPHTTEKAILLTSSVLRDRAAEAKNTLPEE
jgi:hypothetical protein